MGYGHANCQKCGEPTNVYPDVGEDESGILCKDCQGAPLHGDCPREVDEYRNNPWGMAGTNRDGVGYGGYVSFTPKILADAAIASLEVLVANLEAIEDGTHMLVDRIHELEMDLRSEDIAVHEAAVALEVCDVQIARLKVCGNCDEWHPSGHRCYMGDDGTVFTDRMERCHFTPPRWAERIAR